MNLAIEVNHVCTTGSEKSIPTRGDTVPSALTIRNENNETDVAKRQPPSMVRNIKPLRRLFGAIQHGFNAEIIIIF